MAILAGSLLAYYCFVGFDVSANVAKEKRYASRIYPRALFAALLTVGVVYLLLGALDSVTMDTAELAGSPSPLLEVVTATGVGIPAWLFGLITSV